MDRLKAMVLLEKCTGREIWSVEMCRREGIPEQWIIEMRDTFESGFDTDLETIYSEDQIVNQYHGVLDRELAYKFASLLGVDVQRAIHSAYSPEMEVRLLKEAVEEL